MNMSVACLSYHQVALSFNSQDIQTSLVAREATLKPGVEDEFPLSFSHYYTPSPHIFSRWTIPTLSHMLPTIALPWFFYFSFYLEHSSSYSLLLFSFLYLQLCTLIFPSAPPLSLYYCVEFHRLSGCFVSPRHNAIHSYYIKRHWRQLFEGYIRLHNPMIQRMKGELRQMDRELRERWKERRMRERLVLGESICRRSGTSSWEWQLNSSMVNLICVLLLLCFRQNTWTHPLDIQLNPRTATTFKTEIVALDT